MYVHTAVPIPVAWLSPEFARSTSQLTPTRESKENQRIYLRKIIFCEIWIYCTIYSIKQHVSWNWRPTASVHEWILHFEEIALRGHYLLTFHCGSDFFLWHRELKGNKWLLPPLQNADVLSWDKMFLFRISFKTSMLGEDFDSYVKLRKIFCIFNCVVWLINDFFSIFLFMLASSDLWLIFLCRQQCLSGFTLFDKAWSSSSCVLHSLCFWCPLHSLIWNQGSCVLIWNQSCPPVSISVVIILHSGLNLSKTANSDITKLWELETTLWRRTQHGIVSHHKLASISSEHYFQRRKLRSF